MTELVETTDGEPFILHPGEFVLGSTLERVALPDDLVARLEGKSSLGRLGQLIHSTARADTRDSAGPPPAASSKSSRGSARPELPYSVPVTAPGTGPTPN